jgi:hypothetical protein
MNFVCVHASFDEGEVHLALRGDRRDHVQAQSRPAADHDRGAADRAPCGPGVVVGAHAGLIGKVDDGAHLFCPGVNPRVLALLPVAHPLRVLFVGPHQRALGRKFHLQQNIAHLLHTGGHAELCRDQIAHDRPCPQREIELKLARILTHPTKLTFLPIRRSRRAPRCLLHLQRIRPLLPARLQSPENRGPPHLEKPGGVLRMHSFVNCAQRQRPHIFQRPPRDTPAGFFPMRRVFHKNP